MRFWIKGYGSSPGHGFHCLHGGIFVSVILVNDGNRPFAIRVKNQSCFRVEYRRVYMIPDRQSGDHLAGIGVYDCHHFAAATNEQAMIGAIDCHAGR